MPQSELPAGAELTEFDAEFRMDPHARLRRLRAEAPVYRDPQFQSWWLTRYEDVRAVLTDRTLWRDSQKAEEGALLRRQRTVEPELEAEGPGRSIILLDDPDHTRVRAPLVKALYARVAKSKPAVEKTAGELLDALDGRGEFDVMADFAVQLPIAVIARILGVDEGMHGEFRRWSEELSATFNPFRTEAERLTMVDAIRSLRAYFDAEIEARRARPRDDLITDILAAQERGTELTTREIRDNCIGFLVAGNLTTSDLIGNGAYCLLSHPEELAKLRGDPLLINAAVEEILRFASPVYVTGRVASRDMEVGGCPIKRREAFLACVAAANRDPAKFADPDRFDITREHVPHIAFGGGGHICIGAPLARLEGQVALLELFQRFPALRLLDAGPDWKTLPFFRGLARLPVAA